LNKNFGGFEMKLRIVLALMIMVGLLVVPSTALAAGTVTCGAGINSTPCCYEEETAWGDGTRYVPQGNWATYTSYEGVAKTVTLFAGQTMDAGTVAFSDPVDGMVNITITLRNGWHFDFRGAGGVIENSVHIQDYYEVPPAENPAPGQFDYAFLAMGRTITVTLPQALFYGVHTQLIHVVPCGTSIIAAPTVR
jgi:hypothetical protein